jgi:hypothetical protein
MIVALSGNFWRLLPRRTDSESAMNANNRNMIGLFNLSFETCTTLKLRAVGKPSIFVAR